MTARFAVLGSPIAHSLSPALHRAGFAATGRDATYEAIECDEPELAATLARLVAAGFAGVNLTAPLKAAGLALATTASPAARAAGAANTLSFHGDRIEAANTDGAGFVRFLERAGLAPRGRAVTFLGGGGATAGLVPALVAAGAGPLAVVTRRPDRSRGTYPALAHPSITVVPVGDEAAARAMVGAAALVVQATPGAAAGAGGALPCPAAWLAPGAAAVDLLYHPPVTPWLAALRAAGVPAANGLGLLLEQALLAQRTWFAAEPPRRALEEAVAWVEPFSPALPGPSPGS